MPQRSRPVAGPWSGRSWMDRCTGRRTRPRNGVRSAAHRVPTVGSPAAFTPGTRRLDAPVAAKATLCECTTTFGIGSSSGRRATSARARCRRSPRTPRSSSSGATPGRRRRSAAMSVSCAASTRWASPPPNDVDALLALQARLRRLQPDVARHRRAGAHPVGGRERRGDGRVHHRPQPGRRSGPDRRGLPSAAARRCSAPASARASPSCWPSCRRPSATGSTRSRSTRPPTRRSTTRPRPRSRWASASRSTTPTCRR